MRTLFLVFVLVTAGCDQRPSSWTGRPDASSDGLRSDGRRPFQFPEAGDVASTEARPASNDVCAGAQPLLLSSGKATVTGTTAGALNDYGSAIRCGGAAPFLGPQRYYALFLTAGSVYRLTLEPKFSAWMYVFSACGTNVINVDCTSGGATGDLAGPISAGGRATLDFQAPATGTYYAAVDSLAPGAAGTFTLAVTEQAPPANAACTKAEKLTFSAGKVSASGTTLGAANEFSTALDCGLGQDLDGPQVYYSVPLAAGTWYRFSLTPQFAGALWVAGSGANCLLSNLNLDCGGITGTVLPLVSAGSTGAVAFKPLTSGDFVVAVDSPSASAAGSFSVQVESFTPGAGAVCETAETLTLNAGKARVQGTTVGSSNDRGAAVVCGSAPPLVGPQRYFSVTLQAGTTYQVSLEPQFAGSLAVATGCSSLAADCGSGGLSGAHLAVPSGIRGSLRFSSAAGGSHIIVVDGAKPGAAGGFDLLVEAYAAPTHGACSSPKTLSLSSSPLTEIGDTGALANDLVKVSCGLSAGPFDGPQAYHRVSLKGGTTYTVKLNPESAFDPALYAYPAATTCTGAAVSAACTGHASDAAGNGKTETLTLAPAADTDWILAVDSWSPSEIGSYTLEISW